MAGPMGRVCCVQVWAVGLAPPVSQEHLALSRACWPAGNVVGSAALQHLSCWWSVAETAEGTPDSVGSRSKWQGRILTEALGTFRGSIVRWLLWAAWSREPALPADALINVML